MSNYISNVFYEIFCNFFNYRKRQRLLLDQRSSPLETAVYWTEYVIRNDGAYHLQTPARHLSFIEYYLIDVIGAFALAAYILVVIFKRTMNHQNRMLSTETHK